MRKVVCAACKFGPVIIAGPRHFDSVMHSQLEAMRGANHLRKLYGHEEHGFVDQFGVFMDRQEAMLVAKEAGQPIDIERGCGGSKTTLYSEGLY